jgi:hypothetical protein
MNKYFLNFLILLIVFLFTGNTLAIEKSNISLEQEFKNNILLSFESSKLVSETSIDNSKQSVQKTKSTKKAILYSALVPGWGEYYAGRKDKAKYFFAVEAITWIAYFSYRTYGNWRKDDMIRLAAEKAGANLNGRDDHFYDMVGFYEDVHEYNTLGRITDPSRPYYHDTTEFYWNWQGADERENYRELKNSFRSAFKNSETVIGLAILNRLISIVDAVRDVKSYNRKLNDPFYKTTNRIKLEIDPLSEINQITIKWYPPL